MIIVIGGIKGGSGKTTVATNLTVLRALSGKKTLLVDADEQKSAYSWSQQRESQKIPTSWTTVQLSGSSVGNQIKRLRHDYDDIIVDAGGTDTISQRSALTVADIYLIPFQPRSLDIWTLGDVRSIAAQVSVINSKIKIYAFINRGDIQGNDNGEAIEIIRESPELTCLPFVICQRKAFANAATNGLGIIESKIRDKKAISEIKNLYDFIYQNDGKNTSK